MAVQVEDRHDVSRRQAPAPAAAAVPALDWPRLSVPFLLMAALVLVGATAGGWELRSTLTAPPPAATAPPHTADIGPATLAVFGGWTPERVAQAGIAGLDERTTTAFAVTPGLRAHAVVTLAPIDDPSLVPAALRADVASPLGEPRRVRLLGAPAWRYSGITLAGNRLMDVTVAPTTAGVVAVACVAPSGLWAAAAGCATGVSRLSIEGASWLPPAGDLAVRARVPGVVERLDARRVTVRARLRRATTRKGHGRLAGRLGRAYARAAASLAPDAPASGAARRVVISLRRSAAAHRQLSTAARNGWPKRHRLSRRAVKRGDAALQRALSALG